MINLLGEDVEEKEYFETSRKKGGKKYISMQEQFGIKEGCKCKNCKYFERLCYKSKTYFKCALWYKSNSEATDIRANATACNKYEEE